MANLAEIDELAASWVVPIKPGAKIITEECVATYRKLENLGSPALSTTATVSVIAACARRSPNPDCQIQHVRR